MCNICGVPKCGCDTVAACSPCDGDLTDFSCVEYTGSNAPALGLSKYDKLSDFIASLNTIITVLKADSGKVFADPSATVKKTLSELLLPGSNMAITLVGTGANMKLRFDSSVGGVVPDINVKVSSADTTSGYLYSKINTGSYLSKAISSPGGIEHLELDVSVPSLLSTDPSNKIQIGFDGGLLFDGLTRTNPAYNSVWNALTLTGSAPSGVTMVANNAFYRVNFDGTVEFKGYIDYSSNFAKYTSTNVTWQYSFVLTSLSTLLSGVFTSGQIGVPSGQNRAIASQTIIEAPASLISPDTFPKITQMKGYDVEWNATNLTLRLYGIYEAATTNSKAIRVSFEGISLQPNI